MGFGYGIGVGLRQPLQIQYKLDFSESHNTGYYSIFF